MNDRATNGSEALEAAAASLRRALASACRGLVAREALLEVIGLAAVAREHVLVVGPPGTAKSEAVRRMAHAMGGRYFEYLLGRFTEPNEIFGPIDLQKLKTGVVEVETAGMLPEAEIAFLDEVFLGSTAILNTLLGILNERTFRRGRTSLSCPLRVCVGATNQIPENGELAAFADRFLVHVFVDPIEEPHLEDLLEGGWSIGSHGVDAQASIADLDVLAEAARRADLTPVRPKLAHAIRLLRRAGIALSDRRIVKLQHLVAAAAALAGRGTPTEADLWPIVSAVPTRESQALARDTLREFLAASDNETLAHAALETSNGPLARARSLETEGRAIVEARPVEGNVDELAAWKLRVESVARSIDATFARADLPPALSELRGRIVEILAAP